MRLRVAAAVAAFWALAAAPAGATAVMWVGLGGQSSQPGVGVLDPSGPSLDIRESYARVTGVAYDPGLDVLWSFEPTGSSRQPGALRSHDPVTGAELTSVVEPAFTVGSGINNTITDLALNPVTGDLWGITYGDPFSQLFIIDKVDASRSSLGFDFSHGQNFPAAIAFSDDGRLFSTSLDADKIWELDPATGLAIDSWDTQSSRKYGLGWDPDAGQLALITTVASKGNAVSRVTLGDDGFGTLTLVAQVSNAVLQDVAFVPDLDRSAAPVPLPGAAGLLAAGLAGLGLARRRRRG